MLTASVFPPILSASDTGIIYDNLFDYSSGRYSQTKAATIGFDSMSMEIVAYESETRDWITRGLGRHIEVKAASGIVWEGFVNQISVTIGAATLNVGPLLDIANRVKVAYTTRRWDTNPPIGGDPAETAFAQIDESIDRWGTFEEVIAGGEGVEATMEATRDSKLNQLAWPMVSNDFSTGAAGTGTISLSCLGYYHYLERFQFLDNILATDLASTNSKLGGVLDSDPDGLFSSSNANIQANTLEVPEYDTGRSGLTVVQELVGLGFPSGERALFEVGPGRFVTYRSLPVDNEAKYVYSMYDQWPALSLLDGTPVNPWDIRTGEWIRIESLTAQPLATSLPRHSDPRYIFIESVTLSLPNDISIKGGLGSTLKEKVARSTATGMSRG